MADKRSYKEVLASLETHIIYINNHLGNIDKHLEKQNTSIADHGKSIAKNSTWITAIRWVIGLIMVGAITWFTHLQGVW